MGTARRHQPCQGTDLPLLVALPLATADLLSNILGVRLTPMMCYG